MVRRRAKAINFGIIYGISAFGLAAQLGIPQGEAQAPISRPISRAIPASATTWTARRSARREHGYVETLFGRRCHLPGHQGHQPGAAQLPERAAINAPLQGTAADIIKRAMIRMPPAPGGAEPEGPHAAAGA